MTERDDRDRYDIMIGKLSSLETRMVRVEEDVHEIRADQKDIVRQMNMWKGAVPVLMAVGAVVAWLLSQWQHFMKIFK